MNRRSSGLWVVAHLLIMLSFVPSIVNAADSFILVSDVDDTVKITNVLDRDDLLKGALRELVFAGMPELYRQILGPGSSRQRLLFLSCSPKLFLQRHVREILNDSNFPDYELNVRGVGELFYNCEDFKIAQMTKKYAVSPNKFILIGDDTERDAWVYAKFSASRRDQVLAIYIHRITGREDLPAGSLLFLTAYDIAMHEYLAHRLSEQQALAVGNAVLNSKDLAF
jgi:phosphatidate phosphatase APP1